jgi:TonB family protein
MKLIFILSILIFSISGKAQETQKHDTSAEVLRALQQANDSPSLYKVEFESEYPGGSAAWNKFLSQNMQYPEKAIKKKIQGTVVVQFIVDKDGSVSDVQTISGPEKGGLREEAERVIKISGRWKPAFQNGKKVKSYKKQPFVFRFDK